MVEAALDRPPVDRLFFDGDCGLCHGAVRFVARREAPDANFRFAPLDGPTFRALVAAATRSTLPDSLVVLTHDGRLLTRSTGVVYLLRRLRGRWPLVGRLLAVFPTRLTDALYDGVARHRSRLFAAPLDSCPVVSPSLRSRLDP